MNAIRISFRSQFLEEAITLLLEAFQVEEYRVGINEAKTEVTLQFPDRVFLNELRAWFSNAVGCGLVHRYHLEFV